MGKQFKKRLEGLTAGVFHEIMWPTTREIDPADRTLQKYRFLNKRTFGWSGNVSTANCRQFANHICWILGIKKKCIRNGVCENALLELEEMPIMALKLTDKRTQFEHG